MTTSTNVLFIVPVTNNQLGASFVNSLIETKDALIREGIQCTIQFLRNIRSVTELKNQALSFFMKNTKFNYIFFINPELTWLPVHVLQMIKIAKPDLILGGACPSPNVRWGNIINQRVMTKTNQFFEEIKGASEEKRHTELKNLINFYNANTLTYDIELDPNNLNVMEDGLLQVKYMSSDFMIIGREVVNNLIKEYPNKYKNGEDDDVYKLFQSGINNGVYIHDDLVFCYRYRNIKTDGIKLVLGLPLTRTTQYDYAGNFLLALKIESNDQPKPTTNSVLSESSVLIKQSSTPINDTPAPPKPTTSSVLSENSVLIKPSSTPINNTPTPPVPPVSLTSLVSLSANDKELMDPKLSEEEKNKIITETNERLASERIIN